MFFFLKQGLANRVKAFCEAPVKVYTLTVYLNLYLHIWGNRFKSKTKTLTIYSTWVIYLCMHRYTFKENPVFLHFYFQDTKTNLLSNIFFSWLKSFSSGKRTFFAPVFSAKNVWKQVCCQPWSLWSIAIWAKFLRVSDLRL